MKQYKAHATDAFLRANIFFACYLILSSALYAAGLGFFVVFAVWGVGLAGLAFALMRWMPLKALVPFGLTVSVGLILTVLFDYSYDGMHYHFPAALEIAQGRNVLWDEGDLSWANIYPSGTWRLTAPLIHGLGVTTPTAVFNLIFAVYFALLLTAFLAQDGVAPARLETGFIWLAAFSPIVIAQGLTNMQDGLVCSLFMCLTVLVGLVVRSPQPVALHQYGGIAALTLLLVSSKTVGIAYAALSYLIGFAYVLLRQRRIHVPLFVTGAGALMASVAVNVRPFFTNVQAFGFPLPDSSEIVINHAPAVLEGASRFQELIAPIFGQTANGTGDLFRWPWQVTLSEISSADNGTPLGGFGPLFDTVLIVSVVLLVVALLRQARRLDGYLLLSAAAILCFFLIFPEPWWARFVAPVAVVPVLLGLAAREVLPAFLQAVLLGLVMLNSGIFALNVVSSELSVARSFQEFRSTWPSLTAAPPETMGFFFDAAIYKAVDFWGADLSGTRCDQVAVFQNVDVCFELSQAD